MITKRWLTAARNDHIIESLSKCKAKGKIKVFMSRKVKKIYLLVHVNISGYIVFSVILKIKVKIRKKDVIQLEYS